MSRKSRTKIKAKFACHKKDSERFANFLEEAIENQEIMAEFEAMQKGLDYRKMSEERKRDFLCEILSV